MLRLRPYKNCDAKYIVNWITDEKEFRKWCANRFDKYPICADDINHQYSEYEDTDCFFPMTAFDESGVCGHLFMLFKDDEKKILRFGYVIVDISKRGRGYGKEMLNLAIKYAFEILKVEKITLGVFENNQSAYQCYKNVGFQDVDEKKQIYHLCGEDWIGLELELLNQEYDNSKK